MNAKSTTESLISRLQLVTGEVKHDFDSLNANQLFWKPEPASWSIAECLQHLITSNETYFPALEKVASGTGPGFWEKVNPFSSVIGKNMVRTLGQNVVRKFKSPRLFLPKKMEFSADVQKLFADHQETLLNHFHNLSSLKVDQIIITSPVSPLITLPLSDCLEVIVSHEERHLNQAKRVKGNSNFPKS